MKSLRRFQALPVTLRAPMIAAGLMILLGLVASQTVLSTLDRVQNARLSEMARLHLDGLSVALGPPVLRQDVWEIYDVLDRSRAAYEGHRLLLTLVVDERGRVLAATEPRRAPTGATASAFEAGAVAPSAIRMTRERELRVIAPLYYQGREVGRIVTEMNVGDLLDERRRVALWLLLGNAAATLLIALGGWLTLSRLLRPLGRLVRAMDESTGQPRAITPEELPRGDPSMTRLIRTYNRMVTAMTSRAETERRLAERERFVSLGRLSSSLAHEVNNPLGGLLNATDTVQKFADRPDVVRQSAELIKRGLDHLRDVTRAILDQNRLDRAGQPLRAEDFEDLRLLFEPETTSLGQSLCWQIAGNPADLSHYSAAPVRQIALNLLLNASEAAARGGAVGFAVIASSQQLEMRITDSGPGFQRDALKRLLTSSPLPEGGGFGLRLVHDLVSDLGGSISCERVDDATCIRVSLPAQKGADAGG